MAMVAFDMPVPPDLDATITTSTVAAAEMKELASIPPIRLTALKERAIELGVQSGLAHRAYEIDQMLEAAKTQLDTVYDFNALLLDKSVMPAVLVEAKNSLTQSNADTVRLADATYTIERQARFVTTPLNWRQYLIQEVKPQQRFGTSPVDKATLPTNAAEQKVWAQFVTEGWQLGVSQGNQIFDTSLARLDRDYRGMVLYKSLVIRGMISTPFVAEANMGVTGDGHSMNVNDRVLRITTKPTLQTNPDNWKAIGVPQ
ncbi:type IV secretory system conjugative DNA transfer family protein [Burkholderia contaminans]|uniref:type IV secretory system conjugative DNA transfer family protein n=1 Tax=Burkholderia contaminans TaxID=488447 RepID=UPI0015E295E8|nr:type IV secretory system conjugative DNA transfer family protein [Burkholderia contaminans]